MKVLIAIDSFKGSLSSIDCSKAIAEGIREVYQDAEVTEVPLADGGEGTVEALIHSTDGKVVEKRVVGPLGTPITASYGILGGSHTAVIEVAEACGLPLVPLDKRDPSVTTTYGVGELIMDAMSKGCREFVIGLGGSATNDAGIGMLQALGYSFKNKNNLEVGYGGGELSKIWSVDASRVLPLLKDCTFKVACDVNNPLYGLDGAAYIFGPQKGALEEKVKQLDEGLKHFAEVISNSLGQDIQGIPGAGAAGGLGAAFAGFLDGQLLSGVQLLLETVDMRKKVEGADFVITGEGRLDGQTSMGKAPLGIAQLAAEQRIPVIALAGAVADEVAAFNEMGITSYFSISDGPMKLEEAMDKTKTSDNLRTTTKQLFRLIRSLKN